MDRMDYTQAVVRTRVLENKLLSKATIEKLVEAKDLEEVMRSLGDTVYGQAISAIGDEDFEKVLLKEQIRTFELMREISPQQEPIDLVALKYDYHNLKVILKEELTEEDLSELYLPLGTLDVDKLKTQISSNNLRDLPEDIKMAVLEVRKDFADKKDPQRIDILLDRFYYIHLFKLADSTGVEFFEKFIKDQIDFLNVSAAIRLKKQGKDFSFFEEVILYNGHIDKDQILLMLSEPVDEIIEKLQFSRINKELKAGLEDYKSTNRLSAFEKHMDNYMVNLNKESKWVTFGPEPIFSYLVAKDMEIKTLRIIMVSKVNNISPEAIRERLRELYA